MNISRVLPINEKAVKPNLEKNHTEELHKLFPFTHNNVYKQDITRTNQSVYEKKKKKKAVGVFLVK
jgi:hypothetical protein